MKHVSSVLAGQYLARVLAWVAAAAVIAGCATPAPPPPDVSSLAAAGFKILAATTTQQREHLQTLTPGQITAWQRNGREFFIYPDVAASRLYVGTPKEYQAYQKLQPGSAPNVPAQLAAQRSADLASYTKQDVAIQRDNTRDLNDPYYFWPDFFALDW